MVVSQYQYLAFVEIIRDFLCLQTSRKFDNLNWAMSQSVVLLSFACVRYNQSQVTLVDDKLLGY